MPNVVFQDHFQTQAWSTVEFDGSSAFNQDKKTDKPRKIKRFSGPWTPFEDETLRHGVSTGLTWTDIANTIRLRSSGFCNRSAEQCSQRWCRTLDPAIKKGPWTLFETCRLQEAIRLHGTSAWTCVAKHVGGRTDIQCRTRWMQECQRNMLRPNSQTHTLSDDAATSQSTPTPTVYPMDATVSLKRSFSCPTLESATGTKQSDTAFDIETPCKASRIHSHQESTNQTTSQDDLHKISISFLLN